jgi:DNA-binding NtrC family response regulator/tetratricopeptide (TPR) repeat protein
VSARFHYVLGNVYREKGRLAEAVGEFQAAARLSESDPELFCWVQLRLMRSIADVAGTQTAMARLATTRDSLVRFGDKRPFSALHVWFAECETKRGRLDAARHHLSIAESLLAEIDDVWLRGHLAINNFAVCYYAGDIAEAEKWASLALEYSAISGHRSSRRAAYANAGCIEFSLGRLERAEELLILALAECEPGSTNQIPVLHSLSLIKLQRNDMVGCSEIVALVDRFSECAQSPSAYYRAWALQTKIHILLKRGEIAEANILCAAVQPILQKLTSPRVRTGLRLLTAETLVAAGDVRSAASVLASLLSDSSEFPPDFLAETERVLGKTLYRTGSRACARVNAARSIELFHALGHAVGEQHATADSIEFAPQTHLRSTLDISRTCVDRMRVLLDTRKRPTILGRESMHLLSELECVDAVSLTSTDTAGTRAVLSCVGSEIPQTAAELVAIELGTSAQCQFRLEFIPKKEPSAVLTAGIFERLLKSIISSSTMDPSIADTDTFWPSDEWLSNGEVVFMAKSMTELLRTIGKVSSTNVSILISGETGTGKEVVAKIIHERSRQSSKPFVAFNCAAVPKDLVESQLFGHRRGAFSGANDPFLGVIRSADGGTLLLDEIGELPLDIQPKLLRFLDSGDVHPLGEARPIHVDVRLLFATNVDLEDAVKQGRFREDLFFRINVIPLRIPPLRDRREEIPFLTNLFAHRFSRELSKETPKFAAETMESLVFYSWPGNIRQLSNEIRRLIATVEDGTVITPNCLSSYIARVNSNRRSGHDDLSSITLKLDQALGDAVSTLERTMVDHALKISRGQVTEAAKILGLSRKGLYLKRQRLGLVEREQSPRTVFES